MPADKMAIKNEACLAVEIKEEAFNAQGTRELITTDQGNHISTEKFLQTDNDQECQSAWRKQGTLYEIIYDEDLNGITAQDQS